MHLYIYIHVHIHYAPTNVFVCGIVGMYMYYIHVVLVPGKVGDSGKHVYTAVKCMYIYIYNVHLQHLQHYCNNTGGIVQMDKTHTECL